MTTDLGTPVPPEEVAEMLARHKRFTAEAVASVRDLAADDADGFLHAVVRAGRMNGPGMLVDWWGTHRCKVDQGALRAVLADVWCMADVPERILPRKIWVELFRQADYPVPSEPVTLYRGCLPGRRRGMAWTTDLERAKWFAADHRIGSWERERKVYVVTAAPGMMLCDIDQFCEDGGRGECEVVLDPFRLTGKTKGVSS